MATHFSGVGDTSMEDPNTQDIENTSQDDLQDENIVQNLLHETAHLRQAVENRDSEPREAIEQLEQRFNRLTLTLHHANDPIENMLDKYTETLCTAQKKTSLESSLLQDIPTLNGQDSSQLEDWLTDIKAASELTDESRTKLAQANSKGLVRTLISEALIAQKSWEEIKDSLCLKISNADIHTSISHFMDIQQTDKESLATYVHRFKWEASRCKFNNDTATIRIFLKGLKNAHTIATKVYEKGPQTLTEAIKEVEKLQAAQQITSTLLPTVSVNTMSSDNDRCFQCQEISHMAHYCPTYSAMTVIIMDMLPWAAQIRYHCLAHWHAAGLTPTTGVIDHPLDIIATPDILTMITRIDLGSVPPNPTHITRGTGVAAITTSIGVTPSHSTDLPNIVSHAKEAQVPTAITVTHHTTDLHPIGIFPEMTADLNTNPENTTTNQHKDPCPLHKQHLGSTRIRDKSRSPLTTHLQNTTVQMTMIVTQRMI